MRPSDIIRRRLEALSLTIDWIERTYCTREQLEAWAPSWAAHNTSRVCPDSPIHIRGLMRMSALARAPFTRWCFAREDGIYGCVWVEPIEQKPPWWLAAWPADPCARKASA